MPPCLRCVAKACKQMVPMQESNLVQALARILRALMDPQLADPAHVRTRGCVLSSTGSKERLFRYITYHWRIVLFDAPRLS